MCVHVHVCLPTIGTCTSRPTYISEDSKCERRLVAKIARKISNWRRIARFLKLEDADISAIENDGKDEYDKRQKMLFEWMKHNGSDATYYNLIKAFEDDEDKDMVDYIREQLTSK